MGALAGWLVAVLITPGMSSAQSHQIEIGQSRKIGKIDAAVIDESSGLTPSYQYPGCYWTHNDNGKYPGLFLINGQGELLATAQLEGIPFRDWEDMGSFQYQQRNYVLIGDVGDNASQYSSGRIYLFEEPTVDLAAKGEDFVRIPTADVTEIEFTYPRGACDCEAVLVDSERQKIFLVSKSMDGQAVSDLSVFHSLPLEMKSRRRVKATRMKSPFNRHMVTGAQISPDGKLAVIRSYTAAWIFHRSPEKTWEQVFSHGQPEKRLLLPVQRQGEAICFSHDSRSLLLTSEGVGQDIWEIDLNLPQKDR